MVIMLAPLVPHIAEECAAHALTTNTITYVRVPDNPALLVDDTVEVPVQVNGKFLGHVVVAADASAEAIEAAALGDERIGSTVDGATPEEGHRRPRPHGGSLTSLDSGS